MSKLLAVFTVFFLVGCGRPVVKQWQATGGSRGDASIKLSYQYSYPEVPKVSESQALELAKKRCSRWGYIDAEAFGGQITICNRRDPYLGCVDTLVTKEYQCIGRGDGKVNSRYQNHSDSRF